MVKKNHKCKLIVTRKPISGLTVWLVPKLNKEKQVIKILKKYYTSIPYVSILLCETIHHSLHHLETWPPFFLTTSRSLEVHRF